MNFELNEDQLMLRSTLQGFLADNWNQDRHREGTTARRELWRRLHGELGLAALTVPEAHGGLAGGAVEVMVVMQELGRSLAAEAFMPTAVIATTILGASDSPQAAELLTRISAEGLVVTLAHEESGYGDLAEVPETRATPSAGGFRLDGAKRLVAAAPLASHAIVSAQLADADGFGLFLVPLDAAGVSLEPILLIDGQPAANIALDGVELDSAARLDRAGNGPALLDRAITQAIIALGAEATGITSELIRQTAAYLAQRQQFGQPLSTFQVLQHRLAEMLVEHEHLYSMTCMATLSDPADERGRARAASALRVQMVQALRYVSQQAVQLHGGMGITDELQIGHFFKRAHVLMAVFGSADDHLKRYEMLSEQA